jgi:hypothetical protein
MTAATRLTVFEPPGEPIRLMLSDDGRTMGIGRGPADAVRVAFDLLNAALRRFGWLPPEQMQAGSLGNYTAALEASRAAR